MLRFLVFAFILFGMTGCTGCSVKGTKDYVKTQHPGAVIYDLPNMMGDYCFVANGTLHFADYRSPGVDITRVFSYSDDTTEQVAAGESDIDKIVETLIKYHGTEFRYNVAKSYNNFGTDRLIFVKDINADVWFYKFDGTSMEERSQITKLGEPDKPQNINLIQE